MPATDSSSKSGATLPWLIAVFFGFAIVFYTAQKFLAGTPGSDPRSVERLALRKEVNAAQQDLLGKMKLTNEAERARLFARTAEQIAAKKPARSEVVVPGSKTQLEQMQAAPPADGASADGASPDSGAAAPASGSPN
jgi:hypothetical protein